MGSMIWCSQVLGGGEDRDLGHSQLCNYDACISLPGLQPAGHLRLPCPRPIFRPSVAGLGGQGVTMSCPASNLQPPSMR